MEDVLILVDAMDRPIGTAGKSDAHRDGLLHRAFSVFIVHDGKILLQQRQKNKYHSGGLWANACCSHPRAGENLPEAVARRMQQELGFSCPVTEIGHFVYRSQYAPQLFEYEYDHVFVGDYAGEISPNPEEIAQLKWVTPEELTRDLMEHPECYGSWFLTAAPMVLEYLSLNHP